MLVEPKRVIEWLRDPKNHEPITAVFTIGIFLATAVYAVFAIFQWSAMRESNIQTGKIFVAENRPWLSFEAESNPDAQGRVLVKMTNTGKTPATHATDVDIRTRVATGEKEIKEFWAKWDKEVIPKGQNPTDIIGPANVRHFTSTPDGIYAPAGVNSQQLIVVYGRVDYSGAYAEEEHYLTEFCLVYVPQRQNPFNVPWSSCTAHNDMK